jgi:hypothetical protein
MEGGCLVKPKANLLERFSESFFTYQGPALGLPWMAARAAEQGGGARGRTRKQLAPHRWGPHEITFWKGYWYSGAEEVYLKP